MIVEVVAISNRKAQVLEEDFAWQQGIFHVKPMAILRFSGSALWLRWLQGNFR